MLARSSWLSTFPPELRDKLLAKSRLRAPFERGRRVYHVGDKADGIDGAVSGCLGFEIALEDDGPHLAHHLRPGNWRGYLKSAYGQIQLIDPDGLREWLKS